MKIERNKVAFIHYRLADEAGTVVEDTFDGAPVALLMGHGNVMRGLETALKGHEVNDEFDVHLSVENAYGPRREDQQQRVSKKYFNQPKRLKPGEQRVIQTEQGRRTVTILKVGNKMVDVDLNHPLAGQALHFFVKVLEVREATNTELAHGHAHADGHDHH